MPRAPAPGTREKILDVAARLFYAHGVQAVGMQQIINAAGTGKSRLYQHFATKDDLVAAYLSRVRRRRDEDTATALRAAGDDPGDGLVALVADAGEKIRRPTFRGCAFRNYLVEFPAEAHPQDEPAADHDAATPGDVARGLVHDSRLRIDELAARLLGAGDGATALTERILLIVDGLYLRAAYRPDPDRELVAAAAAAVEFARQVVDDARVDAPRAGPPGTVRRT